MSRPKWVLMYRTEWIDGQKQKVWIYEPVIPARVGKRKSNGWRVEAWQRQSR